MFSHQIHDRLNMEYNENNYGMERFGEFFLFVTTFTGHSWWKSTICNKVKRSGYSFHIDKKKSCTSIYNPKTTWYIVSCSYECIWKASFYTVVQHFVVMLRLHTPKYKITINYTCTNGVQMAIVYWLEWVRHIGKNVKTIQTIFEMT